MSYQAEMSTVQMEEIRDQNESIADDNEIPNMSSNEGSSNNADSSRKETYAFVYNEIMYLVKLSLKASSPAMQMLFQESILPTISYYYQEFAPERIQDWIQIYTLAIQNGIKIIAQSEEGKEVLSKMNAMKSSSIRLTTSAYSRQVLIEGVGIYNKTVKALSTNEMKDAIESLPILLIRILDIISSGEAKLLYHSFASMMISSIDLLAKDETTKALTEVITLVVKAMESEKKNHELHMKNQSKDREGGEDRALYHVQLSRKRYDRNKFISQTYTNRKLLKDEEIVDIIDEEVSSSDVGVNSVVTVEDAILSSLGTGTGSDQPWLTSLRKIITKPEDEDRNDIEGDAESLPSRVILPKIDSGVDVSFPVDDSALMDIEDLVLDGEQGDGSSKEQKIKVAPTKFRADMKKISEANESTGIPPKEDRDALDVIIGIVRRVIFEIQIPKKYKVLMGVGAIGLLFLIFVWFLLGCVGLYFLIRQIFNQDNIVLSTDAGVCGANLNGMKLVPQEGGFYTFVP